MHDIINRTLIVECLRDVAILLHELGQHTTPAFVDRSLNTAILYELRVHAVGVGLVLRPTVFQLEAFSGRDVFNLARGRRNHVSKVTVGFHLVLDT